MNKRKIEIGIIGDYDAGRVSHTATINALNQAAERLSLNVGITWVPTLSLLDNANLDALNHFEGLWASPGAPYKSMDGALRGIKQVRLTGKPFIGT